ncbi:MAG: ferredoxin [Desulfocapsaceae bacterium]|nr:ferredoxin [Desulfocapsaceae bacterium]
MGIHFQERISTGRIKRPSVDLGACTRCGVCVAVAPDIFRFNDVAGYLEICELGCYDRERVDEAIKNCPEDCIEWEQN